MTAADLLSGNAKNSHHDDPVGQLLGWFGQKASQAKDWVADNGSKAVNWVVDHSSEISAVTGTLAIITAPIPGLDAVTPVLLGVSIATAAIATAKDVKQGDYGAAAMDALGVIPGAGEAAAALKDVRLGVNLVKDAAKVEQVGRATSDAANISRASASGITKGLARAGGEGGSGLPRNMETVQVAAERYGIGLEGVDVRIAEHPDPGLQAATSGPEGFTLYGPAFENEETLARTLFHERTHVYQFRTFSREFLFGNQERVEQETYEADLRFWQAVSGQ